VVATIVLFSLLILGMLGLMFYGIFTEGRGR
jgi:hypothetical protein